MGKKKRFIDKKSGVTFRLLHRSQKDPLVTDETAPQHVLHKLDDKKEDKKTEQIKYGIYYDDDYDYMQHLKQRTDKGELVVVESVPVTKIKQDKPINLPSSVFPSEVEEKIGVLNRNAPRSGLNLDLDPDVVAAMDSDFEFSDPENELEDDFMELANGGPPIKEEEIAEEDASVDGSGDYTDEERDELMSLETKTQFTEYSMTSSVMRRNEQLTMLDDRFEEMFAEYDENEIGALDTEEIEGYAGDDILDKFIKDFDQVNSWEPIIQEKTVIYDRGGSNSEEEEFEYLEVKPKEKWDCESILSTNSTLYNHPKLIAAPPSSKIKVNARGIPINGNKLTSNALAKHDIGQGTRGTGPGSIASAITLLSIRSKDESKTEKGNRKKAFREYKRERRIEKKFNTEAFKEEKIKMEKMMARDKSRFQAPL